MLELIEGDFALFVQKVPMASKDSETSGSEDAQDTSSDYELESAMEPNCLADTLSGYLESCEPFSVTDPDSSKNLGARNIFKPDALVDPLNSIVLNESFELRDNDGPELHEIKRSSTRRSTRKSSTNQKTDINLTARKTRRTSVKKPMLDLLAADFGRGKRSNSVRRARPLSWGLGGKIDEIFKLNADPNVDAAEYLELRNEVKATHNSQDESQTLNKGLLLKLKVGTDAIYNCQVNKIPDMDKGFESYREVELEASTLQSDIKGNYEKEVPSASNGILDKGMLSLKSSVIVGLYAESRRRGDLAVKAVSVETKCLDPGTSPDSEVINVIPDIQINGIATEGLNEIPTSSKDCISHQSADCGVGSGITSPEIVSDVLLCDNSEHGEKHVEGSLSSGASISVTTGVASGNTSSREECPADLVTSLQETEVGVSACMLTVESGTKADLSIAGIDSVESKNSQNLQKSSRPKNPVNEERSNFPQKELPLSSTANGKNKAESGKAETNDTESHPVTGSTVMSDITGLEEGFRSTVGPVSNSTVVPNAWVCCDDCHKWRRISAVLADAINSTECRWTCKENMDKTFADCSIPQEKSNADINAELELSDVSGDEDASNTRLNSSQLGQKHSIDPPQLSWKLIKTNMFLHRNRKNQPMDEVMVCHCKPPPEGRMGCRDQCLNRMLNIECVKGTCPCGDFCSNQQFQKRKYSKLKCVQSGKKGCGLQLQEDIPKGRFLIEYVGEVLDMPAYEARQREYASKGHKHFYFMTLNGTEVIDACAKGNLGRFINHSCEPNCRTEKWMVNGEVCIGLFAIRDIKKGEELTFDYNYVRVFGAAAKKCVCGSSRCRGVIGGDPLNSETLVLGDSDDEYPEPITFYENTIDKLDDIISTTQTAESPFTDNVVTDQSPDGKNDDLAAPIESTEQEASFERYSCATSVSETKIEHTNELSTSCVEPPDTSFEVNDVKSEIKQQKEGITLGNLLPDDDDSKRKPKSKTKLIKCPIVKPKSRPKLPSPSSTVKKGKSKNKQPEIDNKPPEVPQKPKKIVVDNLTGSFEAVEEALNTLLSKGGISKRRDASKGYLTLLCLTANGGNGEGIQSNRDLSMILDALLRTKSKTVLLDIINKNGLQMLHILLKRYKKVFSKTPILRKLLKVIEFLAEAKILTLDNILKPSLPGVESFKESMLSLTEHADREVHQMARRFRDRHIPWSARRVIRAELDTERIDSQQNSKFKRITSQHSRDRRPFEDADNSTDPRILEGSSVSCPTSTSTDQTRIRKRKSRWDESADVIPEFESPSRKEFRSTNYENVDMDVDGQAPPGFSSPVNRQLLFQSNPSTDTHRCKPVMGQPQDRYNSRLPTSFGIPCSVFRKLETREPNGAAAESWVVAPAMTFHPFPPLPKYPRDENPMNHVKEQPWRNPNFNQPGFHRDRNANTLGRRYFKQQKWNNSRPGHQWNPNKFGPAGFNQNQSNAGVGYGGNENYGNGFYQQPYH